MTELRAPGHDPIPIGEVVKAPFARLPNPLAMFAGRGQRLKALADGHTLRPYLLFLADLSDIQHRLQAGLPDPELPSAEALARSRQHRMPPLDRARFTSDAAINAVWQRLIVMTDSHRDAGRSAPRAGASQNSRRSRSGGDDERCFVERHTG